MVKDFKIAESDFFNQSLCGIVYTTADGTIIKINPTLLGWLYDDNTQVAEATNFINLLSPQNIDWYYDKYLPTLQAVKKITAIQIDLIKSDGTYLPVIIEAITLHTNTGEHYYQLVIIQANPMQTALIANKTTAYKSVKATEPNDWFQAIFNNSPLPQVLVILNTGIVAMVNEAMLNLSGGMAANFVGKPAVDFYSNPKNRTSLIDELIEKGESINKEINFFFKNKELSFLTSSKLVELDAVQMILTSFVNITPQKKNEEDTRLAVEQRNMLLSSISDGFCMVNHQLKVTYWNSKASKMLNIPEDAMMGVDIGEIFEAIKQTDTVLNIEVYFKPINIWLHLSAYPSATGLSIYLRDITDRKKAAKQISKLHETLAAERKLLRNIIDFLPINVFVNDVNARKILANKAEYEFLGATTEEEVLGGNQLAFYDEASIKTFLAHSRQVIQSGIPLINKETTITKIDGSQNCFLVTKIPMYNDEGTGIGMVGISIDITERKKMEDELKNSHQQLFLAHKAAKLGHWTYNIKDDHFTFSPEIYKVYDIDADTFVHNHQSLMQLVHPDDISLLDENKKKVELNKADFNADHRIIVRDGSIKWINVQALVKRNEQDEAIMLIGISQDITDRKQKEYEIKQLNNELEEKVQQRTSDLQRTQAMLYEAQHIAKVGSWELNVGTNKVIWTPEMFKISGFEPANNPPATIERQLKYPAADWDKLQHAIQMAIKNGTPFELELNIYRERNTMGVLNAKGQAVKNKEGKVERIIGTAADISDSKKAQQIITAQRQVFHTILEQSLAGYWDINLQEDTYYFSPALKALFGYEDDEIVNSIEALQKIVYKEDRINMDQLFIQHIQSKGVIPYSGEVRYYHKNGGTIWVICRGNVIEWDKDDQPLRMIGCHIDITKQKTTELYLEKSRQELEAFSYSVSHDLRAPLRGINGWSLALLEDYGEQLNETGKKYIERVREESQRMGNLIDDLLKLSQINRKTFKRTKVNLSLLANKIANRLTESNKNRQMEFTIQQDLIVYGDARLTEILLNNLFENAVKFTAKKPLTTIQFGITIVNNIAAYFIKDNGVGFDMQTADKLFGAFQRLHTKGNFEGSGIGLATVQRIINLHNGQVWANAAVEEGATFYFIF